MWLMTTVLESTKLSDGASWVPVLFFTFPVSWGGVINIC